MYSNKERAFQANRVTIIGSILNVILTAFKLIAGIFGRSSAMIADAIHSLSDFATDIVVIITMGMTKKPQDSNHDYGHGKFETLASVIIGASLLFVGLGLGWNGIKNVVKTLKGTPLPPPHYIALVAAFVSIIVKEWLYRWTVSVGKKINSPAVIANAWHHRSDAFSSLGTLAGIGGAIILGNKWTILDPIAGIVVSAFIVKVALQISFESVNQLLERSLSDEEKKSIISTIQNVEGVADPHHLKTRRIGANVAIDVHIRVNPLLTVLESHNITTKIECSLKKCYGEETFISIHVEPEKTEKLNS